MPRKPDAVAVARITCLTCGGRAALYQNRRRYLYQRCPGCGCNQSNGTPQQVAWWQHAEPIEGAVIERPDCVPESAGEIGCALRQEAPPVVVIEPAPVPAEPVHEPAPEPVQPAHVPAAEPVRRTVKPPEKPARTGRRAPMGAGGLFWLLVGGLALATAGVVATASGGGE